MPKHVGAELLRTLDTIHAEGSIDTYRWQIERDQLQAQILHGKDLGYQTWEKLIFWPIAIAGVIYGALLLLAGLLGLKLILIAIGGLLIWCGISTWRKLAGAPTITKAGTIK